MPANASSRTLPAYFLGFLAGHQARHGKTTLRVVTRPCVSKHFFYQRLKGRFAFAWNPSPHPACMMRIGEKGQRWPLPSQKRLRLSVSSRGTIYTTFRLRATMSDTSAGRIAFALSFIASSPYLIGVALSDLVFPRPEMADGMATKASSPWSCSVLLAISISCFDVCHKNRFNPRQQNQRTLFFSFRFFSLSRCPCPERRISASASVAGVACKLTNRMLVCLLHRPILDASDPTPTSLCLLLRALHFFSHHHTLHNVPSGACSGVVKKKVGGSSYRK